jgi:predicted CoA-substrate-specific enzyme activase
MAYFAGIDVGALSTEAVIVDNRGEIVGYAIILTGINSTQAAQQALDQALAAAGLPAERVQRSVATGYGRISVPFADRRVTEITCHALGAYRLRPGTGTVIDIGGQDAKVIRLGPKGSVVDFAMNDKCAAGTGRFLEVMAARLQVSLADMGDLAVAASGEVEISSVCTVFAESEVVSLIARNQPREEIIRGLSRSIVNRIWSMVQSVGLQPDVLLSGGVAKNRGVVALFEEKSGHRVHIPGEPQIVGAYGAALTALRRAGPAK